ncbi:MAG: DUF4837 family protein [Bacteroidales bacterium]|nr:DUF4837 family protein [Bacteroidales bacterium]
MKALSKYNKMFRLRNLLVTLVSAFALSACSTDSTTLGWLPESSGRSGEVLVVMPDAKWQGAIGDTVAGWLAQEVLVLPQYEPTFKIIRINPNAYNEMFKKSRNIFIADINPKYEKAEFRVEADKHARPQVYITLRAPNDSVFLKSWYNVEKYVYDTLLMAEKSRFLYGFKKIRAMSIEERLKNRHNVDMIIPNAGYKLDVDSTHFVWIARETNISSQGLLIFDFPYSGPKDFEMQRLINKMDSVLMLNVPGPAPNSYMAVEKRLEPFKTSFARNGSYVCELRGLWETEGDFMGGPFVSNSIVDTVNNRLVTAFAYVYGVKKDKKTLLWQLEAILSTSNIHYDAED